MDVNPLFESLPIKNKTLPNRIVMPPMVGVRPITSPEGIEWYGRHARGGVGLVIVEATPVNRFGAELTAQNLKTAGRRHPPGRRAGCDPALSRRLWPRSGPGRTEPAMRSRV